MESTPAEKTCLNCGTPLQGHYCYHCGQQDAPAQEDLSHFLKHFMEDVFHFDSKFARTFFPLLFRPGFLTKEYLSGKRASYFHPIRMFLFLSFVYFFIMLSFSHFEINTHQNGINSSHIEASTGPLNLSYTSDSLKTRRANDSTHVQVHANDDWLGKKLEGLKQKFHGNDLDLVNAVLEKVLHNFSKMIFFLLPFFAAVLWLLYYRQRVYYVNHVVFLLHFFSFVFLLYVLLSPLDILMPVHKKLSYLAISVVFAYMAFAMKNVYRQSSRKTFFKALITSFMFMMLALVAVILNFFIVIAFEL
jgi:hypothetical protein